MIVLISATLAGIVGALIGNTGEIVEGEKWH